MLGLYRGHTLSIDLTIVSFDGVFVDFNTD